MSWRYYPGSNCVDDLLGASRSPQRYRWQTPIVPRIRCTVVIDIRGHFSSLSEYDGGDCCSCTCENTGVFECGDESHGGFACIDPGADCVDDDDIISNPGDYSFTTTGSCIPAFISDGDCDPTNNNKDCGALYYYEKNCAFQL